MPVIAPLFFYAHVYFAVFGVIMIVGGIMGYVKARSVASLVAGGISGVLLIVGALMIAHLYAWTLGTTICLLVSLLLVGRFLPALLRGKLNPAVYVVPLGIVGAILAVVLLLSAGHP